jgi:hypothetical protein
MKTKLKLLLVGAAALALTGCVAVPAYNAPYAYGPAPVVVQPSVGIGFGYYGGYRGGHRHHRHWR